MFQNMHIVFVNKMCVLGLVLGNSQHKSQSVLKAQSYI